MRDENVREIIWRTRINHGFTKPARFVGGICLLHNLSKVFLIPHKFEPMHVSFIVNVKFA